MGLVRTVILSFCIAVAAYYIYNPLPDGIEQPYLYSFLTTLARIAEDIGKVTEFVGYKEMRIFRRDAIRWFGGILAEPLSSYANMSIRDVMFDGVRVRVYTPTSPPDQAVGSRLRPGFVYVHGGGFLMGELFFCDGYLVEIARQTGVVVFSIEYRLAPEHPSPAALHDCMRATRYLFANAELFGVDRGNIGVGGDSAGGNMAAVLSLKYRDEGGDPQFSYQVLIYPWVQALDFRLPSFLENDIYNRPDMRVRGLILYTLTYLNIDLRHTDTVQRNAHVSQVIRQQYEPFVGAQHLPGRSDQGPTEVLGPIDEELAASMEGSLLDPYNFPLMAASLANVPPAFLATLGLDTIRDDGLLYLRRLEASGVETRHYHDDIGWHGSINFSGGPLKFECGFRLVQAVIQYIQDIK